MSISSHRMVVTPRALLVGLAMLAAGPACKSKQPTIAHDEDASVTKRRKPAVTAHFDGRAVRLPYAIAHLNGASLTVSISDNELACNGGFVSEAHTVHFSLAAGPGGTFFAGHRVGVSTVMNHVHGVMVWPQFATVELDPIDGAKRGPIRGSIELAVTVRGLAEAPKKYDVDGGFEARVCDRQGMEAPAPPLLMDPLRESVVGTLAGKPFAAKSVLAIVQKHQSFGDEYVDRIELHADEHVDCSNYSTASDEHAALHAIGGASASTKLVRTKQPAKLVYDEAASAAVPPSYANPRRRNSASAWAQLDSLTFEHGALLAGSFLAENTRDDVKIGGRFTATVCNRGW